MPFAVSKTASTSGLIPQSMRIGDTDVDFSHLVKNLGVTLDSSLSMHQQVTNTCTAAYWTSLNFGESVRFVNI